MYGTTHHLHQLAQFGYLLAVYALVDSIALDEILLQYLVDPLAELNTSLTFHTIANGDDDIKCIKSHRLLHAINTQKMRVDIFGHFIFSKNVVYMFANRLLITPS